jgi:cellulose synthase/poly-beta-1,6-N-acetylglucosamine synthase-like glycosyltransferase
MMLAMFFFRQEIIETPAFSDFIMYLYFISLLILFAFGAHGFVMVYHYMKQRDIANIQPLLKETPIVTIQLPLFNELYVTNRLIDAVCALEYPKDRLEVQVLDDSTDETIELVAKAVAHYQALGYDIKQIHRLNRSGYKAGALKHGLETARGEFIAIFDADFVPNTDFLIKTIPHFFTDLKIGVVQTRWEHINREYSMLTRAQAFALDGHFVVEQDVRNKAGFFIQFNGTGGVWRKSAILDAGNWQSDTLTSPRISISAIVHSFGVGNLNI